MNSTNTHIKRASISQSDGIARYWYLSVFSRISFT